MIRLDKYLSDAGIGTRSEVREYCKKGLVTVDGLVCRKSDQKIDPGRMSVCFRGKTVSHEETSTVCYLLNKPAGYLCATKDAVQQTIFALLPLDPKRFFPIGRLDKDSEGMLLITNDGVLSHKLTSPHMHVPKTYEVWISGTLTETELASLQNGTDIGDDTPCLPAEVVILRTEPSYPLTETEQKRLPAGTPKQIVASQVRITICEGRYHQVKRMFHANRHEVFRLKRISIGTLSLENDLKPGEFRQLMPEEIARATSSVPVSPKKGKNLSNAVNNVTKS